MKLEVVYDVEKEKTVPVDLDEIIKSRALFQANSGGGKSYLLRKFLEESHGKVQQIVIDPEGEFKTLKEKFDYLLVSKEDVADIKLDVRHASLLAKKLMESGASAIIDLYELHPFERIKFVKVFVEALVNLPKSLWHPALIIIDEIHTFAPETSKGISESLQAVADLSSRGRKRGYALIGATQKLSKFHKDVAAELNTKFTGRCVLDIDQKRAAAELGIKDYTELRNLKYEFYAFGPAISGIPIKVQAYKVQTRHEDIGSSRSIKVASQDKIKKLMESFKDLPVEAEQELKTLQDYQKRVQELQIELRQTKVSQPKTDPAQLQKVEQSGYQKGLNDAKKQFAKFESDLKTYMRTFKPILARVASIGKEISTINEMIPEIDKFLQTKFDLKLPTDQKYESSVRIESPKVITKSIVQSTIPNDNSLESTPKLRDGAMKMLKAVAMFHPKEITRNQVAAIAGFSVNGGTFNTYLSELRRLNWINQNGESISITQEGLNNVGEFEQLPTDSNSLIDMWCSKFREGASKMLRVICEAYPSSISKEELGERTGFTPSGGTFNTYLSELRRNNLIEISGNDVIAAKELFP